MGAIFPTLSGLITELENHLKVVGERLVYMSHKADPRGFTHVRWLLDSNNNSAPQKDKHNPYGELLLGAVQKLEALDKGRLSFFRKRDLKHQIKNDIVTAGKVIERARLKFKEEDPNQGKSLLQEYNNANEFLILKKQIKETKHQQIRDPLKIQLAQLIADNIDPQRKTIKEDILAARVARRQPKTTEEIEQGKKKGWVFWWEKRLNGEKQDMIKQKAYEEIVIDHLENLNAIERLLSRDTLEIHSPVRNENNVITEWKDITASSLQSHSDHAKITWMDSGRQRPVF